MDANIQKYEAFIKTVECGSFTKAAAALQYSQSGISRMIKDLERDWNVSLLERDRTGVRLTSDGTMLLPYARGVMESYRNLQMQVDDMSGLQSGLIRIGTFSSVATHWLPNIISEFQKDYPAIEYELLLGDYAEIETWIQEGRVDCGFVQLPTHADLQTVFLDQDELMAVLPQDHPLAQRRHVPIEALCDYPFMMLERGENAEVPTLFQQRGLSLRARLTTWDDYAIMSMVESGLGVSILPSLILKRIPYHIVIKPLADPVYRRIGLGLRDTGSPSPAVKRFMEYLRFR